VSTVTDSSGQVVSSQSFDPWGKVHAGTTPVTQTKVNYTGQRLDDTGLLFYNARYYDPTLARFVSPDAMVVHANALNVDFHESDLLSSAKGPNKTAPSNPQTINRYSYVEDNPVIHTDPTGRCSVDGDSRPASDSACGPQLSGPNHDVGNYADMVHAAYDTIQTARNSADFINWQSGGSPFGWPDKVKGGGDWDADAAIRKTYGLPANKELYFNAGGRTEVADRLFGNIVFGYLGRGIGMSRDFLDQQGFGAESAYDLEGPNKADAEAITFGEDLWERYGNSITEDQLYQEVEDFVRTHYVHTRSSEQQCRSYQGEADEYNDTGAAKLKACDGEPPPGAQ